MVVRQGRFLQLTGELNGKNAADRGQNSTNRLKMPGSRLRLAPTLLRAKEIRTVLPPPKSVMPFYSTPEWKALMAQLIAERGRRCEWPGCGRTDCRIFGDHIKELSDGGAPLDPANVMLLCGSHHTAKTLQSRKERSQQSHD